MDCERFETLILDELYEEIDEVTSAAMKRHAAGCTQCATQRAGLRAAKEAATALHVPVPAGLEDRIFAAVREAEKVAPIGKKPSRTLLSIAGAWAMRPQTAMAALFLLMFGSSAVLLRSRAPRESAALTVTNQGAPSVADDEGAAAAGHAEEAKATTATESSLDAPRGGQAKPGAAHADLAVALGDEKKLETGRLSAGAAGPAPAAPPAAQAARAPLATPSPTSPCALPAANAEQSPSGAEALFQSARCFEAQGDMMNATRAYGRLVSVPAYEARARAGLSRTVTEQQVASRKASPAKAAAAADDANAPGKGAGGGARALAAPAEAAPARPAATSTSNATGL